MKQDNIFSHQPHSLFDNRIAWLINGYIRRNLTVSEHKEIDVWVSAGMQQQEIFEILTDGLMNLAPDFY